MTFQFISIAIVQSKLSSALTLYTLAIQMALNLSTALSKFSCALTLYTLAIEITFQFISMILLPLHRGVNLRMSWLLKTSIC